jgi:predicted nucleic acid-binding Zn ribbon protein
MKNSNYPFGIFWPLYCLFFVHLLILITPLVSFGHCIVCSSSIYWFWLSLWYLLAIVLSNGRRTDNTMVKGHQRDNQNQQIDEEQTIQWPKDTRGVIRISKSTKNIQFNGQKIPEGCIVCSSSIYWFWLPLWYLLAIVLCVLRRFTDSDYPSGIFWPLYCLFFVDNRQRTDNKMAKRYQRDNPNKSIDEEQTIQWPKDTKGAIRISKSMKNRRSSLIYWFWLSLCYLLTIVLCVLHRFTDSDCPFGILSFGHCIVCSSVIQTIQWPKDTKGIIRISKSKKNRKYNGQMIPEG